MQRKLVYCESLLSPAYVKSCAVEIHPLHPGHSFPSTQATTDSVYWQHCRGLDLYGAHPESLQAAKSMIHGCRTVYVNIVIYFPPVILSLTALVKCFIFLVLIVIIF
jgi:hypothetical protein